MRCHFAFPSTSSLSMRRAASRAMSTMARSRDPHALLGVPRGTAPDKLKAAYLKAAMEHHPDRNPHDQEAADFKFKEVAWAYEKLSSHAASPAAGVSNMSRESAEQLFWRLYGVDGEAVGGHGRGGGATRMGWQRYAKVADSLDEETLRSGLEARSLYREVLRELRGVEDGTAADVREAAREKLCSHAHEVEAASLRSLLIDGHHQLDTLRSCLGMAVIRPAWALRPGVHITKLEIEEQRRNPSSVEPHACAVADKEDKERRWAEFVETKLRPAFEAIEDAQQSRSAIAEAAR